MHLLALSFQISMFLIIRILLYNIQINLINFSVWGVSSVAFFLLAWGVAGSSARSILSAKARLRSARRAKPPPQRADQTNHNAAATVQRCGPFVFKLVRVHWQPGRLSRV